MPSPTEKNYGDFQLAYRWFNDRLFDGTLPECLITMQRQSRTYGYFARERFGASDGKAVVDEIALNPAHFKERTTEEVLSTLVHEMVHLWQHHFGQRRSQRSYHNKEWAAKMEKLGLVPSSTGVPGGKKTGQHMSHYIQGDGPFENVCAELVTIGFAVPYIDQWEEVTRTTTRKKKSASKTKYTCPVCTTNAWAKPETKLICGECEVLMPAAEKPELYPTI